MKKFICDQCKEDAIPLPSLVEATTMIGDAKVVLRLSVNATKEIHLCEEHAVKVLDVVEEAINKVFHPEKVAVEVAPEEAATVLPATGSVPAKVAAAELAK